MEFKSTWKFISFRLKCARSNSADITLCYFSSASHQLSWFFKIIINVRKKDIRDNRKCILSVGTETASPHFAGVRFCHWWATERKLFAVFSFNPISRSRCRWQQSPGRTCSWIQEFDSVGRGFQRSWENGKNGRMRSIQFSDNLTR